MSKTKKTTIIDNDRDVDCSTLPATDIDATHNTTMLSSAVENSDIFTPKPATKTTSFYITIGAIVAGVLVTALVAAGWIPEEMRDGANSTLTYVIAGGIAWIVGKYIDGRTKVSAAKVAASAQLAAMDMQRAQFSSAVVGTIAQPATISISDAIVALGGDSAVGADAKAVTALRAVLDKLQKASRSK